MIFDRFDAAEDSRMLLCRATRLAGMLLPHIPRST
jgi:hypothetical protein